jgi:hypothetical protein
MQGCKPGPRARAVDSVQPSENDKLQLIMQVADEVARRYQIADSCELWGEGWLGAEYAERGHVVSRGPLLPYMRICIRGFMQNSTKSRWIDRTATSIHNEIKNED